MMKKIVYICHPVSGDVKGNMEKIRDISRSINLSHPDICPIAPYFLDCHAMDDNSRVERSRGIRNGIYLFDRKVMDEVWLYGDRISKGMNYEILKAHDMGIPVVPKSEELKQLFLQMIKAAA